MDRLHRRPLRLRTRAGRTPVRPIRIDARAAGSGDAGKGEEAKKATDSLRPQDNCLGVDTCSRPPAQNFEVRQLRAGRSANREAKGRCAVKIDFSDDPALTAEINGIAAFCGESSEEVVKRAVMLGLQEMGRKLALTIGPPMKGTAPAEPEGGVSITAGRSSSIFPKAVRQTALWL